MTVVSMCHISSARVVRRPTFGFIGCTRSRGRRQPNVRTRSYQVEGEAQTCRAAAPRRRRDGTQARGRDCLERPDFGWVSRWGRCADRTIDDQRYACCSRRQAWNRLGDNRRNRRSARNGTNPPARSTARTILVFAPPWGRRSCVNANPRAWRKDQRESKECREFLLGAPEPPTSCWSSGALRSDTSRPTTTFGALSSHPRPSSEGSLDPWRWSRPPCVGRDPEAGGRSAAERVSVSSRSDERSHGQPGGAGELPVRLWGCCGSSRRRWRMDLSGHRRASVGHAKSLRPPLRTPPSRLVGVGVRSRFAACSIRVSISGFVRFWRIVRKPNPLSPWFSIPSCGSIPPSPPT
jgi:hypothetical protein